MFAGSCGISVMLCFCYHSHGIKSNCTTTRKYEMNVLLFEDRGIFGGDYGGGRGVQSF